MRLAVLDVGSNTLHLLVVDAHHGAAPSAALSRKFDLRLAESLNKDGELKKSAIKKLIEALVQCKDEIARLDCVETLAFATSAIRDAANSDDVLAQVRNETGIELQVLDGEHEAILTFLAVRRWYGWSAGRLLVADIGGGSLEVAQGSDEHPDFAASLPLGAGRLTRDFFLSDPPEKSEIKALRKHVRASLAGEMGQILRHGEPEHVVATSKTFRQLARITGAAPSSHGPFVRRILTASDLDKWVERMSVMSSRERATLPGVSEGRAGQLLAGAIVAQETMDLLHVDMFEICPWALREGIILRRLDWFEE
jgi:exopolyphosphatase/guanosine-5'-triphosphate,3'-diphosphate pyrophosphatase